jgi:hypothetical protein
VPRHPPVDHGVVADIILNIVGGISGGGIFGMVGYARGRPLRVGGFRGVQECLALNCLDLESVRSPKIGSGGANNSTRTATEIFIVGDSSSEGFSSFTTDSRSESAA